VNPLEPRWVYRRRPGDPGRCFARDAASIEARPRLVAVAPAKGDRSKPPTAAPAGDDPGRIEDLPDGRVVLITDGFRCGAFVLRDQRQEPSGPATIRILGTYDWWLRRDGFGRLDPEESGVDRGRGALGGGGGEEVRFGGFFVWWAGGAGAGQLSYRGRPIHGEKIDCLLCVTDRTDLVGLDAQDPKWVYKRTADDPGWRFEKPPARK
jgi:hypothetical protein